MTDQTSFWMRHLDSLKRALCPRCKTEQVLPPLTFSEKIFPPFAWHKRHKCSHCNGTWTAFEVWWDKFLSKKSATWTILLILAILAGLIAGLIILLTTPVDPVSGIKKMVRSNYDEAYGGESQTKLWSDWGWLYDKNKGNAKRDYYYHKPK